SSPSAMRAVMVMRLPRPYADGRARATPTRPGTRPRRLSTGPTAIPARRRPTPLDSDRLRRGGRDGGTVGGITVERVARSFGEVEAVRHASFSVPRGHVAGLIVPTAAGKTTLLLMLATLLAPDAGSIRIAGFDPVTQPR